MELVKKYFNKEEGKTEDGFEYIFEVSEDGLYLIEIIASAKSWWQNFRERRSFFRDDDLTVKIDGMEFSKLNGKRGLFDGEVAWNGNNLKGLSKTNVFIINLFKGAHVIAFLSDKNPILKSIKIDKVNDEINYIPQELNPAEDGDRRQWINIALVNLPLKHLSIKASANYFSTQKDGDDVKLIIDGEIQKNKIRKDFENWYWCGKELLGKEKEFNEEINKEKGLHYIELWADKSPCLKDIKLSLGFFESGGEKMLGIKARVIWQLAVLRQEADQNSPAVVENISEGREIVVLEKAVAGIRPKNEVGQLLFSDRWHKAEYQGKVGYIYSESLEIEGEDTETIKKFIVEKSETLNEDENIILAIAKRESKFFPYCVSQVADDYKRGRGVLQITDQTREEMKENKQINYDLAYPYDFKQNIEGGILYLTFIRSLFKEDKPDYRKKILTAWNQGPYSIPSDEKDNPLDYNNLSPETREFVQQVENFYEEYKKISRRTSGMFLVSLICVFFIFASGLIFYLHPSLAETKELGKTMENDLFPRGKTASIKRVQRDQRYEEYLRLIDDVDGDRKDEEITFHFYYGRPLERLTDITFNDQTITADGYPSAYTADIDNDGKKELIVELGVGMSSVRTEIYQFKGNKLELIPVVPVDGRPSGFFNKSGIELKDEDGDGISEIHVLHNWMDTEKRYETIYEYKKGKLMGISKVKKV